MLLGFDIGGTKCSIILGSGGDAGELHILHKSVFPTDRQANAMIQFLFQEADELMKKKGIQPNQVNGIGISCGGPLDSKRGIIQSPPNLPGWDNIPIVQMAEDHFRKKAFLQNDANACAVAEWKYGVGRGYNNLVFLTFGTGMGAGLILDGRLYSGTNDLAGEVGHLRLAEMGPVGFGKAGSFEGYCSGGGIAQLGQIQVRQKLQMGEAVSFCRSLQELPMLTAKIIAEAAYRGDETALNIYKTCGHYLGRGLALLIDILNPEIIIMGSIYGRAESLLKPAMEKSLSEESIALSRSHCKIVPAGLGENIGDMAALCLAEMIS